MENDSFLDQYNNNTNDMKVLNKYNSVAGFCEITCVHIYTLSVVSKLYNLLNYSEDMYKLIN